MFVKIKTKVAERVVVREQSCILESCCLSPIRKNSVLEELRVRRFAVAKRPRDVSCLSVVSFNSTQRRAQSSIISHTLALDLPLRKLHHVLFSSTYSLVRGFLCRKQTCTVTVIHHWTDGRTSVDSTSSRRHRSIARYRPTIALTAARRRSIHSMQYNQILAQNRDHCLPHLHSTPESEYCHDVWYRKTTMVWLPDGENFF